MALDSVVAHMMGCPAQRLPFLQRAKALGLGDFDLEKIEIDGELIQIPNFKLPPMGDQARAGSEAIRAFLHSKAILRPKADPSRCTACGTCVAQCPVQALSLPEDLPIVDADICIACFCCQEICPEKAITLQ